MLVKSIGKETEMSDFFETDIKHVWQHLKSSLYTFEDETNNFYGMFFTQEEAEIALKTYIYQLERINSHKTFAL